MKLKSLFVGISAILLLAACNSGGGTTTSDVQSLSTQMTNTNGSYAYTLTATGCQTISSNGGNCNVTLAYSGTGLYANLIPQLNSLTGYSTNNIAQACNATSSSTMSNPCYITITSNSGTNTNQLQTPNFSLGTTNATITFNVGGGI